MRIHPRDVYTPRTRPYCRVIAWFQWLRGGPSGTNSERPVAHKIEFTNPETGHFKRNIYHAARLCADGIEMVEKGRHADAPGAVIASTGPTIENSKVLARIRILVERRGWTLIALKESIAYLHDIGLPVSYSVSMDPGAARQITRTPIRPGVTYCLASSCNPDLYSHLIDNGARVEIFHSACGYAEPAMEPGAMIPLGDKDQFALMNGEMELTVQGGGQVCPVIPVYLGEVEVYDKLFPIHEVMCGGFAVVNRAWALAQYLGFPKTVLAGADFGWRDADADSHYASFVTVGPISKDFMKDGGNVDGREWYTRPDQLASAAAIAKGVLNGDVEVLGDSLAASLAKRGRAFVNTVVKIE